MIYILITFTIILVFTAVQYFKSLKKKRRIKHRIFMANYMLKNSDKCSQDQIKRAKKVIEKYIR